MNHLKPITRTGLGVSVRDAIEAAIVHCELAPGTQLVDRHLAMRLSVSRTPVREALQQLEQSGLVRRQDRGANFSWVVAEFRERDVRELFELRRLLEPLGLKWLGDHWDEGIAHRLATAFDAFGGHVERDRYEDYIQRDREVHKEIVTLSHNGRVVSFYGIMEKQIDRIRHFLSTGYEGRMDKIVVEHEALCAAIAAHDIDGAIQHLIHHLHQGEEAMIRFANERHLLYRESVEARDGGGD
jgi:DNA-binding GntR family transcriptional regulator